jgi:SAM-dependent methyltransferase
MRRPPDELPLPPALRELRRRAFSTGDALLLVEAAAAADDPYLSALLRAEAHAASGDLPSAIDLLADLWARHPDDLAVLHRLAAARRALAQRDWQPRPCAIHVVSSRGAYRDLARDLPRPGDAVIEVGCSEGLATRHLARTAALVVALDISHTMIDRARARLAAPANVHFLCADASDPTWPGAFLGVADLVLLDVAGSAPARQAMALARDYRDLYLPRALVLRNMELADFISATAYCEEAPPGEWRKVPLPHLNWPWSTTAG